MAATAKDLAEGSPVRTAYLVRQWCRRRRDDAAVLLLLLGEAVAGPVLRLLEEEEVVALGAAMLGHPVAARGTLDRVARAFIRSCEGLSVLTPDTGAFLRGVLARGYGAAQSQRMYAAMLATGSRSTVVILGALPEEVLADMIVKEHPQAGAVMLSLLAPQRALDLCRLMAPALVLDLVTRLTQLQPIGKEAMEDLRAGMLAALDSAQWRADRLGSGIETATLIAKGLNPTGLPKEWLAALRP